MVEAIPQWMVPVGVGMCLSTACGFRTFLPLLLVAGASRVGLFPLAEGQQWLASTSALLVLLAATVTEIVAYFVPVVDNASDVVATPLAIGAGALMMLTTIGNEHGALSWALELIFGGGTAGVVQAATVKLRALSTGTTAGTANGLVAGGELLGASGLSFLALFLPVIAVLLTIVVLVLVVRVLLRPFRKARAT